MKKTLLISSMMLALAAAGVTAQDTDTETDNQTDVETDTQTGEGIGETDTGEIDTDLNGEADPDAMGDMDEQFDHADIFLEMDTDESGAISRQEAEEHEDVSLSEERFDALDVDGDGNLTLDEFMEFEPEQEQNQ